MLLQLIERAALAYRVVGEVDQCQDRSLAPDDVVGAAGDVGEEGVADVQHQHADGAAAADAQRSGRPVAHEAEFVDRLQDAKAGLLAHDLRAVEDVAHRARGDAGAISDLFDGGRRHLRAA